MWGRARKQPVRDSLDASLLKKSNPHYTHGMTPKRITSGGIHLRDLASEQHSSGETSQRWRAVGDTVIGLTGLGSEPKPPAPTPMTTSPILILILLQRKGRGKGCRFAETMGGNYFDTFASVRKPSWYIAFQKNGKPKKGPKTSKDLEEVMFLMFLKQPNHKRVLLSTSSPSSVDEDTWAELEKRIRSQILFDSSRGRNTELSYHTMLSEHHVISPSTPPEIQLEIEKRRQLLMKLSDNGEISKKKKKKTRKNKRKQRKTLQETTNANKLPTETDVDSSKPTKRSPFEALSTTPSIIEPIHSRGTTDRTSSPRKSKKNRTKSRKRRKGRSRSLQSTNQKSSRKHDAT